MPKVLFRLSDGQEILLEAEAGQSVMQLAVSKGVPGIDADCGGSCSCATCHVYVESPAAGLPAPDATEDDLLDFTACERSEGSRLSCQLVLPDDADLLVVRLPERQS